MGLSNISIYMTNYNPRDTIQIIFVRIPLYFKPARQLGDMLKWGHWKV